jgi:hypothetical protein
MEMTREELIALRERCQSAATHGHSIGIAEHYVAVLSEELGEVDATDVVENSPEHIVLLVDAVLALPEEQVESKAAPKGKASKKAAKEKAKQAKDEDSDKDVEPDDYKKDESSLPGEKPIEMVVVKPAAEDEESKPKDPQPKEPETIVEGPDLQLALVKNSPKKPS